MIRTTVKAENTNIIWYVFFIAKGTLCRILLCITPFITMQIQYFDTMASSVHSVRNHSPTPISAMSVGINIMLAEMIS